MMTFSDGAIAENQRFALSNERRLRKLNKKLSRQVKGSNNWRKTVYKLRQLHATIRNQRQDWLHKWTTWIASNHGIVCIEDLNVKGMLANHKLAKHIADVSFYEIRRQLDYKTKLHGGHLQPISRWFASSKTCSECGSRNDVGSSETYCCTDCGIVIDRDWNAAINILNEGLRLAYS
jgi:putative transposase